MAWTNSRRKRRITSFGRELVVEEYLGRWVQVGATNAAEILAVHAALLRTGKIVYFGGDQHTGSLNAAGDVDHTRLFDCATHAITTVTGLTPPGMPPSDIFCAGHSLLHDGGLLVAGGTKAWTVAGPDPHGHGGAQHFIGSRDSWLFDPASESWIPTGKLNRQRGTTAADPDKTGGRWYPTVITLANGSALAVSGHPSELDSRHNNSSLELYAAGTGAWSLVGTVDSRPRRAEPLRPGAARAADVLRRLAEIGEPDEAPLVDAGIELREVLVDDQHHRISALRFGL